MTQSYLNNLGECQRLLTKASSGHRLAFNQLITNAQYDLHTVQYTYDAANRLSQTVSAVVTDICNHLLDLQPGLSKALTATTGANVDRFVHSPQGIHAQHDATNGWQWMIQDGG